MAQQRERALAFTSTFVLQALHVFFFLPPLASRNLPQSSSAPPSIQSTCNYDSAGPVFPLLRLRGLPVRHRWAVPSRNGSRATVMHCCLISSMKMSHPIVLLSMIAFLPLRPPGGHFRAASPSASLSSGCYISLSCLVAKKKSQNTTKHKKPTNLRAIETFRAAPIMCNVIIQSLTAEISKPRVAAANPCNKMHVRIGHQAF